MPVETQTEVLGKNQRRKNKLVMQEGGLVIPNLKNLLDKN